MLPSSHKVESHRQLTSFTQLLLAAEALYVWTMICFKISLALFFLRILIERWQHRVVYAVVTLSTLVGVGYFWYAIFECGVPNDDYWEKLITHQCKGATDKLILGIGDLHAAVNAFTDIVLISLPIPVIIRAKLALREKIVVTGILLLAAM
jgi:hypothetical protein